MKNEKIRCFDCKKLISIKAKRCKICANIVHSKKMCGKNNPMYGRHRFGKNSPNYKNGKSIKIIYCKDCKKQLSKHAAYYSYKRCSKCSQKNNFLIHPYLKTEQSKRMKTRLKNPKMHPMWQGGIARLPYPYKFKKIRIQILKYYKTICQICEKFGKEVHHIDYNKQNNKIDNLICLCKKCHGKTNFNRDYWYAYFKYITKRE
jgi:hypothetical protein